MAGSNLNQVFIAHSDLVAATESISKAQVGIYDIAANDFAATDWTALKRIAIMQGTAGRSISSPVLDTRMIRRVDHTPFDASAGCKVLVEVASGGAAPAAGRTVTFRFVIKTAPTNYLNYYPGNYDVTLDTSSYEFPLNGFHNNNHKVIPVDILTTGTLAGDLLRVKTAVEAHPVLNAILSIGTTTTTNDTFTARHIGVNFDIAFQDSEDLALDYEAGVTGFKPGVGNGWQVLENELQCQFKNGNFQRTHIPVLPEQYSNPLYKYDKLTIEYVHNWPTSTGIAPAGELNQLVIYVASGETALADAAYQSGGDFINLATAFGLTDADGADVSYAEL